MSFENAIAIIAILAVVYLFSKWLIDRWFKRKTEYTNGLAKVIKKQKGTETNG